MFLKNVLLIDIGSTNIKWTAQNCDGNVGEVRSTFFPEKSQLLSPYFEVNIDEIIDLLMGIIKQERDCEALFISTQMHGYILTDENYKPITNYISWRDKRAEQIHIPFTIDPESGTSLKYNLPKASLYSIKCLQPELFKRAQYFFTLGSYFVFILLGQNATHITDACPTGFYSAITGVPEECKLHLPISFSEITSLGQYQNMMVFTPIGDHQASITGAKPDMDSYILNLGTAAQLCCIEDHFISGEFESRPYFNGKTLCTVTGLFGGQKILEYTENDIEEQMFKSYQTAIEKLPKRKKIFVTGGVLKYHMPLIKKVLDKLGIPVIFDLDGNAIQGLSILTKEIVL